MLNKVKDYIKKYKLLNYNDLYIVALSGGADSVALLTILDEMGYKVHAAHCNFHLRGEESDRDEAFCEQLCLRKNVPFHRIHFDTMAYVEAHRVSVEMAARELRYRYFEQLRKDIGAEGICVAHHRDDSVETVLMNLIRGTGLRGLCGIQPQNGYVLRPLLTVSRKEIEDYLSEKGQEYVTDSTNLEADVLRNKIRLQVIPLLRELNPAVVETIQRMTENLVGAQAVLDAVLSYFDNRKELILSDFDNCASREYITYEWLKKYGFNGTQVRQLLEAETGRIVTSSTGYDALRDRDRLLIEPSLKPMKPQRIPEEGTYILPDIDVEGAEPVRFMVRKQPVFISKSPDTATVEVSKVLFPLSIRRVEEGDWMIPYGMTGRKLLNDLMTDRKMTLFEKRRQLVVVDAKGNIVWMVGLRVDARVAVGEMTSEVYVLCLA